MFHYKMHSLSNVFVAFFGVRFVETVCYVFQNMHSLSSKRLIFFDVRFVETVCYVFQKTHSLSSEIAICWPFAVGFALCVS